MASPSPAKKHRDRAEAAERIKSQNRHNNSTTWRKNDFRSCDHCDGNSGFSRDLILIGVSELNGIVRFIVSSVCRQFGSC